MRLHSAGIAHDLFASQCCVWLGGLAVWCWSCDHGRGFESQLPHCQVQPGQVVNTHVSLSPSSIIWYQPVRGDALRGVALATRHRH